MKRQSLVIGRTNAGKTLFCLQFAKYLGIRELQWLQERTDGATLRKKINIDEAVSTMASPEKHTTRQLQSLYVDVPRGKTARQLIVTDSTGLSEGIHEENEVRQAMAQTLRTMVDAQLVLHVVDAHAMMPLPDAGKTTGRLPFLGLDSQLVQFGMSRPGYLLLANKMDLPGAEAGLLALRRTFPKLTILPISAQNGTGFREVKRYVWRLV
jgi:GTPase Era involved in 16S rRNA processing